MKKSQIIINNVILTTADNIEFYGILGDKQFKITKDLNVNTNEFNFSLDVEKQKRFVVEGTFQSIEDCLKQIQ